METDENKKLFELVYKKQYHNVLHFAQSYLSNREEAECVVQDTFLAFYNKIDEYEFAKPPIAYLLVIAKNKCLNILKKRKVRINNVNLEEYTIESLNIAALERADHSILHNELLIRVKQSLEEMPPIVRETFIKSRNEGLKYEEMAQYYSVTVKAIEYRMMCALKIIRKNCKNYIVILLGIILSRM